MAPLTKPIAAPARMVSPIAGQKPIPQNFNIMASSIVSSAIAEPGLRSIPPTMITAVDPMAISATMLT